MVRDEVVIQTWQIRSASGQEFYGGMNFERNGFGAFNRIENLLLVLPELIGLTPKVLSDLRGAVEADQGGNVV